MAFLIGELEQRWLIAAVQQLRRPSTRAHGRAASHYSSSSA